MSVHDLMPDTLDSCRRIFDRLESHGLLPATLLVVPGTGWSERSLGLVREMADAGAELAGHGWRHRVTDIRGLKHRLHSLFISRDVAEHLALDRRAAIDLMRRCHGWFAEHDLPAPELYVPPAWAMGDVPRSALQGLPFACYETLAGVYDSRARRFLRLPMVGYEADNSWRALAVRRWNALNRWRADSRRPLRIAIHPRDPELLLAGDLRMDLGSGGRPLSYGELGGRI